MNQLSGILQDLIPKKGKSKSEVVRKLGISSQLLGQYEKGGRKPGGDFFLKWRQVFGEDLLKLIENKVSASEHTGINGVVLDANIMIPGNVTLQDHIELYKKWLADKEAKYLDSHSAHMKLLDTFNKRLEDIATNLMTGQHQLKEQLFAVGESLGQQLDGISSGLAAKDRAQPVVKKGKGVSGQQNDSGEKGKSH